MWPQQWSLNKEESSAWVRTNHVCLRGLHRGVDGVRAAIGQVFAHPLLHVGQQFLPTATAGVRTRGLKISPHGYSETPRSRGGVCASTYRLVNLKDVWRGMEVGVELVYEHVQSGDLLCHGVGHLERAFGMWCGDISKQQKDSLFLLSVVPLLPRSRWWP